MRFGWIKRAAERLAAVAGVAPRRGGSPKEAGEVAPSADSTVYTCPMHPEVQSSGRGTCPRCAMRLERKEP